MPTTHLAPARIHGPSSRPVTMPPIPSGSIDGSTNRPAIAGTAQRIHAAGRSDLASITGSIDQGDVVAGGSRTIAITG